MILKIKINNSIAKKLVDFLKSSPIYKIIFKEIYKYSHIKATTKKESEIVEVLKYKEYFKVVKDSKRSNIGI